MKIYKTFQDFHDTTNPTLTANKVTVVKGIHYMAKINILNKLRQLVLQFDYNFRKPSHDLCPKTFSVLGLFLILFCLGIFSTNTNGQVSKFSGGVILGGSISQLNGDEAYGFNKFGPLGGVKVGYRFDNRVNLELELLYNEKGSARARKFREQSPYWQIKLNYFEMPLLIGYKDWFDKDYYHMIFYAGLSYGYLFNSTVTNEKYRPLVEGNFRKHDLAWILGATYNINKHLGVTGRYNRSILKVWKKEITNDLYSNFMLGYQFSLAVQYMF